jgi:outer membrane protein OmpA-like peptidoglycan-associated protein
MPSILARNFFVRMKTPYDRIALTSFNKDLNIKVPLSQDTSTILNLYRAKLQEGQGLFSGVFDAMYNTIDILKDTPEDDPRMLVIFTDGDDNYSKADLDKLIPELVEHDIHVFTVAFGYSKDDKLRQIAHFTGGRYYKAHTKEELIAIFRDIYMSLKYFYKISYVPPRYVGYHRVFSGLNVPGRKDSLIAEGEYSWYYELGDTLIKPILFDYNKATIRPESFIQVDEIVDMMMIWPKLRFEIQGHTDNIGGHEFNMDLSERRAKAVFEAIVERGIDERRLRYRGFGFTRPRESNETDMGRQQNRRTEFIIIAK